MANIQPYLTFNGNCREAMTFYNRCLHGELEFQTVGESPLAHKLPEKMQDCILHATLTLGNLKIMATDLVGEDGLRKGNNVSLALVCSSEEEIERCFSRLSAGGKQNQPLVDNFWGTITGDITDRFGNHWILNYDP